MHRHHVSLRVKELETQGFQGVTRDDKIVEVRGQIVPYYFAEGFDSADASQNRVLSARPLAERKSSCKVIWDG